MARTFGSPAAFRKSLEARLKHTAAARGIALNSLRLKVVIERLLARLFNKPDPPWLLKGGFAMELRFRPKARTTKDVDLAVVDGPAGDSPRDRLDGIRESLQVAAAIDLGDYLDFRIAAARTELQGAPLGGGRFPCEAVLAGKTYVRFHIDVGFGDAVVGVPEKLTGEDLLSFAGIEPAVVLAVPTAQQFAEKVHAYTYPWTGRTNTRAKDLIDLLLLIESGLPDGAALAEALRMTFSARSTHPLPSRLPPPPESWQAEFPGMAAETGLTTQDLHDGFARIDRFWNETGLGVAEL